jgi:hypothetical protein
MVSQKTSGFPENLWFPRKPLVFHRSIPDTKDLTSYSSSSMSKILRSTLMGTSWYLSKSMFFWPLRTDKQASKQTIYVCKTLLYEKENRARGVLLGTIIGYIGTDPQTNQGRYF